SCSGGTRHFSLDTEPPTPCACESGIAKVESRVGRVRSDPTDLTHRRRSDPTLIALPMRPTHDRHHIARGVRDGSTVPAANSRMKPSAIVSSRGATRCLCQRHTVSRGVCSALVTVFAVDAITPTGGRDALDGFDGSITE